MNGIERGMKTFVRSDVVGLAYRQWRNEVRKLRTQVTKVIVMTWSWEIISKQSGLGTEWSVKGDAMQDLLDCRIEWVRWGKDLILRHQYTITTTPFFHSSKQDSPSDETNSPIKSR